ncbi:MAG TPA: hypothetical protein VG797_02595, partial [Phycisphaerales bacterium]|nr:hypothetical protein [Phycisphaerales bacterium]
MIQSALWRRLGGAFAGVLVLAVGVAVPRAVAAEPSTQPSDELVKQFAECLEVRTDRDRTGQVSRRAREELLFSLRQLKDQRLKPLFAELAASKRADFRRHGILGLAELSEDHRLNVLMVAKLEDPA